MNHTISQPTRRPRRIVSIHQGNAIQLAGLVIGSVCLWISAQPINTVGRIATMIAGYLLFYFNSHSLLHYVIGTSLGLRFRHYSIGGSAHASSYPGFMRILFERLPFFAAHTEPRSMKAAQPYAKALMFASGIAGTVLFSTAGALFAYYADNPGGSALLIFNIIWLISSLIAEMRPMGDLGKALQIIRNT